MKTILSLLLLLMVVSCAQTPAKKYQSLESDGKRPVAAAAATQPVTPAAMTETAAPAAVPSQADITAPAPADAVTKTNPAPVVAMAPRSKGTNAPAEEILAAGMINFESVDINQVLKIYAELVNRTMLRPANLAAAQISLKTQTALTKTEAIQALDAIFAMNGIGVINIGDKFAKVVPIATIQQEGAPRDMRSVTNLPDMGQYLYQVVQLKYVKPTAVVPVLTPFAKAPNSIMPIDDSYILVLRDYTENIKRMLEMIAQVDVNVPAEFKSEVIPIKYAKAEEISAALNSLSSGGGGASFGTRSGGTGATRSTGGGLMRSGGMGGGAAGGMGGMGGGSAFGTQAGGATAAGGAGGSYSDRLRSMAGRAAAATGAGAGDMQILGQTKIIADLRSNALLIFATKQDMEIIKDIVAKLDVVLAQVLIETVILDVQIGKSWALGVSAGQQPKTRNNITGGGSYNNSSSQLTTLDEFITTGLTNGIFPASSGLSLFGRYKGDLDIAVSALATDSRVNVVQKPRILTSHAKPGSIFIGSTVPYVTSSSYGGYNGYSGNSYQQLRVGIGLQVTPYINQDGLVVMEIEEQIEEISGSTTISGVGDVPNTTSRTISAEVAVRDGDTIVLGGFIRNSDTKSRSGIPILKDIPILGALFRSKSDNKERKELLVLMRPTVLKTPELAAQATLEQKKLMPGISSAEVEIRAQEKALIRSEKKKIEQQKKLSRMRGEDPDEP